MTWNINISYFVHLDGHCPGHPATCRAPCWGLLSRPCARWKAGFSLILVASRGFSPWRGHALCGAWRDLPRPSHGHLWIFLLEWYWRKWSIPPKLAKFWILTRLKNEAYCILTWFLALTPWRGHALCGAWRDLPRPSHGHLWTFYWNDIDENGQNRLN